MTEHFDAVVIGAGPGGEVAVSKLHAQGLSVALVERELIGGPSPRRSEEVRWLPRAGVSVFKGVGALDGPGRVRVGDVPIETERVVIATGTAARIPPIEGLEEAGYRTNREATTFEEIPPSIVILGGGPVGIELAQLFNGLGSEVTLIEAADRLLAREEPSVSELIAGVLRDDGVEVIVGPGAMSVARADGKRTVELEDGTSASGTELVVAADRAPRIADLGLESVGIEPDPAGIQVDERCRAAEGVWAIGDVTGTLPFTHVAKYQARIACRDMTGGSARADCRAVARVVFSDPEIAAVGLTETQARERGIDVRAARVALPDAIARPWA